MKNLNLFRKSARGSEGSTLASTIVRPSFDCRSTVVKHLAFMLLFLLGSLNVWGTEVEKTMNTIVNDNSYTVSSGNTATCYTSFSLDANITVSTSGSANCGSFWGTTTKDWRLYQNKSGNVTITAASGYDISKITITYNVSNSGTLKDGSTTIASGVEQSVSGSSKTYTVGNTGNATNGQVKITKIKVVYAATGGTPTCENPSFSPVAGAVASGTNVSISSTTEGATIYYTTDGSTPTTSSATAQPIEITTATTIKAIAVKYGYDNSDVATAAYTIVTPKTIAQIMPTSETEGDAFLLNDVTVTYVSGTNIYVKDASGYILVYDKNSAITGAANGKVLQGLQGKAKLYKGLPEISTVTQAPTVNDGSTVDPEELDAYPTDDDLNKYVTLEGVTFASAQTLSTTGSIENITGSFKSSNLTIRNTFKIAASLAAGTSYRVVGVVQKFNTTYQLYPISFAEQADPTVTLSPAALDFGTIGVGDDAPAAQTFTVSGSNLTENLTASVTAGSDYYDIAVTAGSLDQDGGTVSATITVTPKSAISANAGAKAGTITVSGNGLSETVSLTTEVKAKHTVTWNNNGTPSTTQVIDGEKPSFPTTTPVSCDATSTTFVGWATAPWDDKIDDLAGKTVHTSNATMDAVTTDDIVYYAVFAKSAGGAFDGTTEGTYKIYAINDETKYYATNTVTSNKLTTTTTAADAQEFTFAKNGDYWTISYLVGEVPYYLTAPTSNSGNISAFSTDVCNWKIEAGEYGSWRVWSRSTNNDGEKAFEYRALMHNKSDGFKNYCPGNNYLDCEIGSGASMSDYMTTCCEKHSITIDSEIAHGNVVADKDEACEGKTVTLTPTADPAYHFDSWDVYTTGEPATKITVTANKFDMPAYDVTVSASFEHDPCTNLFAPTLNGEIAVTYNSATINWNSVEHAVSYDVTIVRHSDSEVIFSGNMEATGKALTGLDPETQYDYSIMGVGDGSDYCTSGNNTLDGSFTTSALPEVQLWLVKKQGAAAVDGGKHALGVEFDITPSDLSCTKTFVGWTDAANKDYTHATDAPSVLINKYTFTTEDAVTLYAVYAEVTPGATTYTLTPAASMSEGTYVIAAYDENYKALTGTVSSGKLVNETTGSAIDGEGKLVSLPTDACEFTFTAVTGGYSIQKPNDDYLGYTSTSENNKLAFGDYSSLVWSVNANAKDGSPDNGVSLTTSAYKVSANASAGSDTWVRGYKSSGSIYQPIYLFKKATAASTATNYATTCADVPEATPSPASIEAVAAGASGTITMVYENVNTSALDVTLCNDAAGEEAFTGGWLSASLSSTNISYTVNPNTTYEARTAYIKLTAPETTGATDPAVVIIPVTQAKYIPEFASLADLVAANIPTGTDVKVSFSHILISDDIAIVSGQRKGVYLNVKAENDKDIEIYYAATPYVPESWVKNGYVSATDLVATWTYYNQYSNDQWELVPASGFNWANDLVYEAPSAALITVTPSGDANFGTITQGAALPADKTITVTLTNVANATATLGGTNPEAFSITPASPAALTESGDITISVVSTANVGTYSATLTITDGASAAESKVVNLSLTVEDVETAVSTTSNWVAATAADLVDGAEVLITGVKDAVTYAMGADRGNNRGAVAASVDGKGVLTPGEGTMSFILEAQGDETFALRTSNGKYLYAASSSANQLKTRAVIENGDAKWTLSATSAIANGSNTNETIRFNGSNNPEIFSCYADETKQADIQLYVPKPAEYEPVRSGLEVGRHYTVCLPKNITHIKGATFWNLQYKNAGNTEVYLVEETAPEAGKPYIIQATDTKLEVVYGEEIAADPVENGALRGTFTGINATNFAALEGTVYLLINNAIRPRTAGNYLDANRAYVRYDLLTVPQTQNFAPGKRVRAMPMAPQVATGVDQVPSDQVPNTKVLIDGQLFILRGEKVYDAKGQLVK